MGVLYLYNITWRGLACVAYPYLGAMRRPEHRDRRGGINSHVFFISKILIVLTLNLGVHRQQKLSYHAIKNK